jgi:hypothetical protein
MGLAANAQTYTRSGNTFISSTGERDKAVKTKFTWKDSKGKEYPVYISNNGSCFVIKVSAKTVKEYRNYLGPEISQQICKELSIEYKSKRK